MKNAILFVLVCLSLNVSFSNVSFADEKAGKGDPEARFQKTKARMLENIALRMQHVQKHQSCVNSASTLEALQKCKQENKDSMMQHKQNMQSKRSMKKKK